MYGIEESWATKAAFASACSCEMVAKLDRALVEAWKSLLGRNGFPTLSALWGHPEVQKIVRKEAGRRLMQSKGSLNLFFFGRRPEMALYCPMGSAASVHNRGNQRERGPCVGGGRGTAA